MPPTRATQPDAVVGVVFPGDTRTRATWSGSPAGIASGLAAAGVGVQHLSAHPPLAIDFVAKNTLALRHLHDNRGRGLASSAKRSRFMVKLGPEFAQLRTWTLKRRLRARRRLDGLIQIGTGYSLPPDVHGVTFEDMTVVQALRHGYPGWAGLSERAVAARIERQRRCYRQAAACCVTTHWAKQSLVEDYGVPSQKVHVVGVGRNHSPPARQRDWSTPRFLFVGFDWEGKNGPGLLRAFAEVKAHVPSARLDVVGRHPRLGVDGVEGHGPLRLDRPDEAERLDELFQAATCFVMPSHREASAIVYVEAGAAGLPSIGTSVGGSRELIGDGGRVVDPTDSAGLVDAMLELTDPTIAARVGEAAAKHAQAFTWPAVAQRLLRALEVPGLRVDTLEPFL
jgi:glycosyltransferase involved in cell wall biosynthesis